MSAPSLAIRALDLLGSEWTKFRSVRSTYWSLLVAVVTPIAVSAVVAFAFTNAPGHGPPRLYLSQNLAVRDEEPGVLAVRPA